jgi:hypothetical protein
MDSFGNRRVVPLPSWSTLIRRNASRHHPRFTGIGHFRLLLFDRGNVEGGRWYLWVVPREIRWAGLFSLVYQPLLSWSISFVNQPLPQWSKRSTGIGHCLFVVVRQRKCWGWNVVPMELCCEEFEGLFFLVYLILHIFVRQLYSHYTFNTQQYSWCDGEIILIWF